MKPNEINLVSDFYIPEARFRKEFRFNTTNHFKVNYLYHRDRDHIVPEKVYSRIICKHSTSEFKILQCSEPLHNVLQGKIGDSGAATIRCFTKYLENPGIYCIDSIELVDYVAISDIVNLNLDIHTVFEDRIVSLY